jgi:predicted PurR-regulated permease PerM
VLLPLTLGLILDFLFRPVVRRLKRRIPEPAGAALVILAVFGGCALGIYELSGPASDWLAKAPRSQAAAEGAAARREGDGNRGEGGQADPRRRYGSPPRWR